MQNMNIIEVRDGNIVAKFYIDCPIHCEPKTISKAYVGDSTEIHRLQIPVELAKYIQALKDRVFELESR